MFGNQLMNKIIHKALDAGIEITLKKTDGNVFYNLNVQAKSGLEIKANDDGTVTCYGRYDYIETIESWEELLYEIKGCLHGRDYMNEDWITILSNEGVLTVNKTTTVKVSLS